MIIKTDVEDLELPFEPRAVHGQSILWIQKDSVSIAIWVATYTYEDYVRMYVGRYGAIA